MARTSPAKHGTSQRCGPNPARVVPKEEFAGALEWFVAPAPDRRAKTCRRRAFLLSTAIGAVAAGGALPWLATPAEAACVVTGSGAQAALQSGDSITCTGAGNTQVKTGTVVSGVTVNIGDGSATSGEDAHLCEHCPRSGIQ